MEPSVSVLWGALCELSTFIPTPVNRKFINRARGTSRAAQVPPQCLLPVLISVDINGVLDTSLI